MNARELLVLQVKVNHDREAAEVLLNDESDRNDRLLHLLTTLGWWTLIAVIAACAMCCASPQRTRTVREESSNAVRIEGVCMEGSMKFAGSGVIVGPHTILTAEHVMKPSMAITDSQGNLILSVALRCTFTAHTTDGQAFAVVLDKSWKDRDVARVLSVEKLPFSPVELANVPEPGERVCVMAAFPTHVRKCGDVQPTTNKPPGDIHVNINVEPGNSGSGVYSNGRLVGIVTHRISCVNGDYCEGRFASITTIEGGVL